MGSGSSSLSVLSANPLLQKYVGREPVQPLDPFWDEFLSFSWLSSADYNMLENIEEVDSSLMRLFKRHNADTHHLVALMQFIISRSTQLLGSLSPIKHEAKYVHTIYDKELVNKIKNGLLVFRVSAKYLLENTTEQNFSRHLSGGSHEVFSSASILQCFFNVLFKILIKCPVDDNTYGLHCDTIMAILVLLARQMHREISSALPLIFFYVMWGNCATLAPAVVHRLICNFSENLPAPPELQNRQARSNFIWRAASSLAGGLLSVVTLGYSRQMWSAGGASTSPTYPNHMSTSPLFSALPSTSTTSNPPLPSVPNGQPISDLVTSKLPFQTGFHQPELLSNLSSLLLLVLTTQAGSLSKSTALLQELGLNPHTTTTTLNPYRVALFTLHDGHGRKQVDVGSSSHNGSKLASDVATSLTSSISKPKLKGVTSVDNPAMDPYPIDFSALVSAAANSLQQDNSTLLLYLLLHRNVHFRAFLLDSANYAKLLMPLLNILYRSPADSSHLVYMALIIILILSEHEEFATEIHATNMDWVQWSPNRRLTSISQGSLVILVLVRTIRFHVNQLKDRYLHVNILAALANLSSKVANIHPYASDSVICLLELLTKRYNRAVESLRRASASPNGTSDKPDSQEDTEENLTLELRLLEEVIRMLLEILNSVLTHAISANANLVYSLLYKRDCFSTLREHPSFQTVIQNLDAILNYFSKKIEQEIGESPNSPAELLTVINRCSSNIYRCCNLKKLPDLKFKYVEEESPDDFFIPYVWSFVLRQSGIPFRTDSLRVFASPEAPANESEDDSVSQPVDRQNETTIDTAGDVEKETVEDHTPVTVNGGGEIGVPLPTAVAQ